MTATDPIGLRLPAATHRARRATPRHRADRRTAATLLKETPHALRAALRYLTPSITAAAAEEAPASSDPATDRACDCPAAPVAGPHRVAAHDLDCGAKPADPNCTCWGCLAEQVAYHQIIASRGSA